MYSVSIGNWHVKSINTGNGLWIGSSDGPLEPLEGPPPVRARLLASPCWSSGSGHGSDPRMGRLWQVLFRHGVDVALNGHDHLYERFALMNRAVSAHCRCRDPPVHCWNWGTRPQRGWPADQSGRSEDRRSIRCRSPDATSARIPWRFVVVEAACSTGAPMHVTADSLAGSGRPVRS